MSKDNFLININSLEIINELSNEQAGIFIKAIMYYQLNNSLPDDLDFAIKIAVKPVISQIDRDKIKYQEVCKKRALAGASGGKQKQQNKANLANASKCKQNLPDNEYDNEYDNKKDIDKNNKDKSLLQKNEIPDFISIDLWNDFLTMRKAIKKSPTYKAKQLLIGKLTKFYTAGHDIKKIMEQSILNNYQDFYELKQQQGNNYANNQQKQSRIEIAEQALREIGVV